MPTIVDAILFLQPSVSAQASHPLQPTQVMCPPSTSTAAVEVRRRDAVSRSNESDRLFPVPLLKCRKHVFTAFVSKYDLRPKLIEALNGARRRKRNRKFQRVTRNRKYASNTRKPVNPESDDEGDCATIDDESVYAQLMAVCGASQ